MKQELSADPRTPKQIEADDVVIIMPRHILRNGFVSMTKGIMLIADNEQKLTGDLFALIYLQDHLIEYMELLED